MIKHNNKLFLFVLTLLSINTSVHASLSSFLDSDKAIINLQFMGFFAVLATFLLMYYAQVDIKSSQSKIIGILLTIFGLLQVVVWDVNYMVIATALFALAGVFILHGNSLGKIIYGAGLLVLTLMAQTKYGINTQGFFAQTTLPFIIGVYLLFFLDMHAEKLGYDYEEKTEVELQKQRIQNKKLLQKMENQNSIDVDKTKMMTRLFALLVFLMMVIMMLIEIY